MKTHITSKPAIILICLFFLGLNFTVAQDLTKEKQQVKSTIWDGTSWSNGLPNDQTKAIFTADFTSEHNIVAESIEVAPNAKVTFESGNNLIVINEINVSPLGNLTFKVNANLSQRNPSIVNTTLATFIRETPPITKFDYVYWSSPVQAQNIGDFSPDTLFDKYLKYSPSGGWESVPPATTTMTVGKGYAIRGPQPFVSLEPFFGTFTGVPNNTNVTTPIEVGENLIGNPYPEALSADCFILDYENQGVTGGFMKFWTHNIPVDFTGGTPGNAQFNYNINDLAAYNLLGGVGTGVTVSTSNQVSVNRPQGYVASGQGFVVSGLSNGNASFKTTMRSLDPLDNQQFFRGTSSNSTRSAASTQCPVTRHRIWIRITNGINFKETLLGYAPNATTSATIDRNYDLESYSVSPTVDINTLAPVSQSKLTIQGRQLTAPFNINDVIPLAITCPIGITAISGSDFDGIFDTQYFWLRENIAGNFTYYDIRTTPYTFNAALNNNTTRFQIVFKTPNLPFIIASRCGSTLGSEWDLIDAYPLGQSNYHVLVRNSSDTADIINFNSASNRFNLNRLGILPNTTYTVRVAIAQIGIQWIYSQPCLITTASPPKSFVYNLSCPITISNSNTTIQAFIADAYVITPTQYTFNVTSIHGTYTFSPTVGRNCSLYSFSSGGIPMPITTNTDYIFTVNTVYNGLPVTGGPSCTIRTANILTRKAGTEISFFEASTYPNPFADNFKLNINTSSENEIQLFIYDMLGREMETRIIQVSDLDTQEIGNNYASGIYNVILKQGENSKTLRVIKR